MVLKINKLGKIKEANIEIKGITLIAGENNSGKSTVGKALFSIFNSFYRLNEKIKKDRIKDIKDIISDGLIKSVFENEVLGKLQLRIYKDVNDFTPIADYILSIKDKYKNNEDELISCIINKLKDMPIYGVDIGWFGKLKEEGMINISKEIITNLNIPDEEMSKNILYRVLEAEFANQINNINDKNNETSIILILKNFEININIKNNQIKNISNIIDLYIEAVYIDNPYIIDYRYSSTNDFLDHRKHLANCLNNDKKDSNISKEIRTRERIESILAKLQTVNPGDLIMSNNGSFLYNEGDTKKAIEMANLSTGLKTFSIIKKLLLTGFIKDNGTIILDEPEIHLHPEWQIILAELLVLIQNEFNMHILITTHSPYFLNAIEVYSKIHGNSDKCKYYLSSIL